MVVLIILIQASESSPRLCVKHFSEKISTISTHVCVDQTNIYLGKTLECVTKHTLTTELPDSEREQLVHWNYIQQYMVANASSCWYMNGSEAALHGKYSLRKALNAGKLFKLFYIRFRAFRANDDCLSITIQRKWCNNRQHIIDHCKI